MYLGQKYVGNGG